MGKKTLAFLEELKNAKRPEDTVNKHVKEVGANLLPEETTSSTDSPESHKKTTTKASGEREPKVSTGKQKMLPDDIKMFLQNMDFGQKISVTLPVSIVQMVQDVLLSIKREYGLNNREINLHKLISYTLEKGIRDDEFLSKYRKSRK